MNPRWLAPLLVSAAVSATPRAVAEVTLRPAADGQVGAWLVSGPLPLDQARALAEKGAAPSAAGAAPRFRLLHSRDGALDLDRALGTGRKSGSAALLGGTLVLDSDLDGVLLASIDGAARLYLGEKPIWDRPARALRGGGWDAIPLRLPRGSHQLVLVLEHPGNWWALELRLLDARNLLAPSGARVTLAGTTDADADRLTSSLLDLSLHAGAGPSAFLPKLLIDFPRGTPLEASVPLRATVRAGTTRYELELGRLPLGPHGVSPYEATLPSLDPRALGGATTLELELKIGKHSRKLSVPLQANAPSLLARAAKARSDLDRAPGKLLDPTSLSATLEADATAVARSVRGAEARLEALLTEIEAGRDPLLRPGVTLFARRSSLDGEPDPTALHVPAGYAAGGVRRYPLVVVLHGLNGNPQGIMDAFLDSKSRGPSVDGFVLAPHAHGNAFYRGPGELEVMAALKWAVDTYAIDPARVSITGVSMGGTGAGHLGLRYLDHFAAAAPLCGYHSYFVRRDTRGRPIRPWETERMHHWSPATWAERGRNLPMWVAHGTKDFPLENSKVLVERYKQLGYSMTDEWPDTGHDVWTKAYAGARLFPWLSRARRDPGTKHITVKTDSLRFGKIQWATIRALSQPGRAGSLDVDASASPVRVKTAAIEAFELERGPRLAKTGKVELEVDGTTLTFDEAEPVLVTKRDKDWTKGAPSARGKRAGLEGPIRDAFLEPLIFSYGSGDPRTARANREVALALSRRHGSEVGYRIVADVDLDETTMKSHAVVAVGSSRDHVLLARIGRKLPIFEDGAALVAGSQRFDRPGTGAIFISPNPEATERYLLVVTGVDAAGIWRALSLPQLLPDFLVYDERLGAAAAEVVLGRDARVLAGGFFDWDWKLPALLADPEASAR